MPLWVVKMLKKRLGIEAIEREKFLEIYFKIPSTLIIPEGCWEIGQYAFRGCRWLEKVIIPKSVERVGDCAFECCGKAEITVKKAKSKLISGIGINAFYMCKSVEYVKEETGN